MKKLEKFYVIIINNQFLTFDTYSSGYPYLTDWFADAQRYKKKHLAENDLNRLKDLFTTLNVERAKIQKIEIIMED